MLNVSHRLSGVGGGGGGVGGFGVSGPGVGVGGGGGVVGGFVLIRHTLTHFCI